jgi:hypothetical protein
MRHSLAIHEAGHAVIAHNLGIKINEIVMNQDPAYVSIQDQPEGMKWQYLLFSMIGNVIERKLDPVSGWGNATHDLNCVSSMLDEGTTSWSPPGLAEDDEDSIGKIEEYIDTFTDPAFDHLERQAARIIEIPEIWEQISDLAGILLHVDRLSGREVNQILAVMA